MDAVRQGHATDMRQRRAMAARHAPHLEAATGRRALSPSIVQEVTPMTTLTGLVAAGVGMGFVAKPIASIVRAGVVYRQVDPAPPRLPMVAAWRKPALSPVGERFLKIVVELVGKRLAAR
jgi:DNA-binding transcriptional LysR family regulator